jgi:hypothetical protein
MRVDFPRLRWSVAFLSLLLWLGGHVSAEAGRVFYTFRNSEGGGIAEARITSGGQISGQRILVQHRNFKHPFKLAESPCGRWVAATGDQANFFNLAVFDHQANEGQVRSLLRTPDAIEPWRGGFVIGANDGTIYLYQPETKKVFPYNLRINTYPPARKAEYILIDGDHAWITIQKDSPSQRTKGSRVIYFNLATWKLEQDLMMARNRPDLELNSFRERGPSPEIVLVAPRSNTILLSMDVYGGVSLSDLDAARSGGWKNWSYASTAVDGSFGTAFPDRWVEFTHQGKEYALILNAGVGGGAALVDLAERQVIQRLPVPPGLENPVWLSRLNLLAAGVPGKEKRSFFGTLEERRVPVASLFTFQMIPTAEGPRLQMREIPMGKVLGRGATLADSNLAVFPTRDELLVVDPRNGQVVSSTPAVGKISRLISSQLR